MRKGAPCACPKPKRKANLTDWCLVAMRDAAANTNPASESKTPGLCTAHRVQVFFKIYLPEQSP